MTIDTNAAPAGDSGSAPDYSEETAVASIEALIGNDEDEEDEGAASPDPDPEAEAPAEPDEDAQPDEESEPDAEPTSDKLAHGNQKTRLRDGREVTVAELKKAWDEAQELKTRSQEWDRQQAQFREHAQRTAQQEQFFHQNIQNAIAIQQAALGNPPDPSLRETDPIEYFTQKDRFESKRAELGRLIQAQQTAMAERQRQTQAQTQQSEVQRQAHLQSFVQEQQKHLTDKMPELKSPEKAREFYTKVVEGAKEFGFTPDEVNQVYDHRLLVMMKDAMAYRALQKGKPVAQQKAKQAAPVQAPGRRVTPNEAQSREQAGRMDQLRKSGSQDLAASILMDMI